MFSLFYNLALLLLGLLALPRLLWLYVVQAKYRGTLAQRLGLRLPPLPNLVGQRIVWIHAVSMGEVRALGELCRRIQRDQQETAIVISTTTQTGLAEAQKSLPMARAHFLLPLDFSWVISRYMSRLNPSHLVLCESDFWYHLLLGAKQQGARITLINGKLSERSCRRFHSFSWFSRRLFSLFDTLCVQTSSYADRFLSIGVKPDRIKVTGNLKLEIKPPCFTPEEQTVLRSKLGVLPQDPILVIGSTHEPEEEQLLECLMPLLSSFPRLKILLVPRHPERFNAVAMLLEKKGWHYERFSCSECCQENLILVDTMGQLTTCYSLATLAIVAGSYTSRVGGHNIFEPVQQGVPVFFGPYMATQLELKGVIISGHSGKEVPLEGIASAVYELLSNPQELVRYRAACIALAQSIQGTTKKTYDAIFF